MNPDRKPLLVGGLIAVVVIAASVIGFTLLKNPVAEAPTVSRSPTPTPVDIRTQVEQAYLAYWEEWTKANLSLDPARLELVAVPPALDALREAIESHRANGEPARVRVEHNYEILVIDANTASVDDNYINHTQRVDPASKEPIEPDPNSRHRKSHTLRKGEGLWKVSEIVEYR